MAEKVEKLGVNRDKDFMYYVKDAAVWRVQRKQPGVPKGRPEKVAEGTFQMDTDFIYFVDRDGDVSRAKRAVGGQKRKKSAGAARTKSAAKRSGGAKKAAASKGKAKPSKSAKAKGGRASKAAAKKSTKAKSASKGAAAKGSSKKGAAKKKRR